MLIQKCGGMWSWVSLFLVPRAWIEFASFICFLSIHFQRSKRVSTLSLLLQLAFTSSQLISFFANSPTSPPPFFLIKFSCYTHVSFISKRHKYNFFKIYFLYIFIILKSDKYKNFTLKQNKITFDSTNENEIK